MSVSLYIEGIVPPSETWNAMKAVWDACDKASVPCPEEVVYFFNGKQPDGSGTVIHSCHLGDAVKPWKAPEGASGFEIEVGKLPKHVTIIRAALSW